MGDEQLDSQPSEQLERLTTKEREALELLLLRLTTKQIARSLELAPNTIDMRLRSARVKLGTRDRNETARVYQRLLEACGKTTCGPTVMSQMRAAELAALPERSSARFRLQDAVSVPLPAPWHSTERAELPEVLDNRFGKVWRIAAIPLGALTIALLALALLAIAEVLGAVI